MESFLEFFPINFCFSLILFPRPCLLNIHFGPIQFCLSNFLKNSILSPRAIRKKKYVRCQNKKKKLRIIKKELWTTREKRFCSMRGHPSDSVEVRKYLLISKRNKALCNIQKKKIKKKSSQNTSQEASRE